MTRALILSVAMAAVGCSDRSDHSDGTRFYLGGAGVARVFRLDDGTQCVALNARAIDCDWGSK